MRLAVRPIASRTRGTGPCARQPRCSRVLARILRPRCAGRSRATTPVAENDGGESIYRRGSDVHGKPLRGERPLRRVQGGRGLHELPSPQRALAKLEGRPWFRRSRQYLTGHAARSANVMENRALTMTEPGAEVSCCGRPTAAPIPTPSCAGRFARARADGPRARLPDAALRINDAT